MIVFLGMSLREIRFLIRRQTRRHGRLRPDRMNTLPPYHPQSPFPIPPGNDTLRTSAARPRNDTKHMLRDVLGTVRHGWWIIIVFFVAGIAATWTYVSLVEPQYEARSLLLIDTKNASGEQAALAELFLGPDVGSQSVSNQMLVMQQSLQIAERTARQLRTMETLPATDQPLAILASADSSATDTELALMLHDDHIRIEPGGSGVDAVWVIAASPLPDEAALIANLFAEAYVKHTQTMSSERVSVSRAFLEEQVMARRRELVDAEAAIESYMRSQGAVALDEAARQTVVQTAQLEAALDEARVEQQMREAALMSIEDELEQLHPRLAARIASGAEKEIDLAQQEIAELEVYVQQIYFRNPELQDNPAGNAQLQEFLERIARLRARVRTLSEQYVNEMLAAGGVDPMAQTTGPSHVTRLHQQRVEERVALRGLQAKQAALQQRLASYEAALTSIPTKSIELAQLQRAKLSTERLYNLLVEKLQEASIAEESELGFARIIRPAMAPVHPAWPPRTRLLALGALLGLMLGLGAAVLRQRVDTRLHTPDALRTQEVPLLAVVPDMERMIRKDFNREQKVVTDGGTVSTTLPALLNPFSAAAEAYWQLYLRLHLSRPNTLVRTILITSPEAAAGKTTTALNLALTTARAGQRTLIIDADLRRPSLDRYLELGERPHLGALLTEEAARAAAHTNGHEYAHHELNPQDFATHIDNFYAVPALMSNKTSPAELLNGDALHTLLAWARNHFDVVIVDSPPLLAAADALLLAAQCDATLLVASAHATDSEALAHAVDELRLVGATVAGTVLNRFDPSFVYGYQSTYGYQYGYQYGPQTS